MLRTLPCHDPPDERSEGPPQDHRGGAKRPGYDPGPPASQHFSPTQDDAHRFDADFRADDEEARASPLRSLTRGRRCANPREAAAKGKKKEPAFAGSMNKSRQRPTLPHGFPCSSIGSEELNFRVRDGIGCGLLEITTGNFWIVSSRFAKGLRGDSHNPNPARDAQSLP